VCTRALLILTPADHPLDPAVGTRKASLLFSSLVLFGVFLVAIGDGLVVMMIGR